MAVSQASCRGDSRTIVPSVDPQCNWQLAIGSWGRYWVSMRILLWVFIALCPFGNITAADKYPIEEGFADANGVLLLSRLCAAKFATPCLNLNNLMEDIRGFATRDFPTAPRAKPAPHAKPANPRFGTIHAVLIPFLPQTLYLWTT